MEIHQLGAFQTVARTGNLTRAAAELHLSQSALSTQIRNLEDELGVSLFIREAKGMRLTPAGESLLPHAGAVLRTTADMAHAAMELRAEISGALNIGLNTDPTFLRLNRVIRTITSALPKVALTFCISQTLTTEAMLKRGEMDMGFAFGSGFSRDISVRRLTTTPISVVVPKHLAGDPSSLDWKAIAAMPWVWTTCQCPFHLVCRERMDEAGVRPNTVRQGMGVIWEPGELEVPLCLVWLASRDADRLILSAADGIAAIWEEDD
jgi:DNA-binding transcriptional LysR family regulator